jgi:hypothetical protein
MSLDKSYRTIELPSRGLLYDDKLPNGEIKVKLWDTSIEELFLGGGGSPSSLISEVLDRSIVDCPLSAKDLLSGDRYYAFFMLRSESYGDEYGFQMKCSNCGLQFRHEIKLMEDLQVIELEDGSKEPFSLTMPYSEEKIEFKLLRGADEEAVDKFLDKIYRTKEKGQRRIRGGGIPESAMKKGVDPSYKFRLARQIVSIDGREVEFDEALEWVSHLMARDSLELRRAIDKTDPRLDMRISVECLRCEFINDTMLPFTPELLSPR